MKSKSNAKKWPKAEISSVADLSPHPKNPRKITEKQLDSLTRSITEFGDLGGVVWNVRSKRLVGGHQRVKTIAADAKIEITKSYDAPTRTGTVGEGYITVDGERFAFREVDWDEKTEMLAMISANKQGGEWDMPVLREFVLEFEPINIDWSLTGFSDIEMKKVMEASVTVDAESETTNDLTNQWDQSQIRQLVIVLGVDLFEKVTKILSRLKEREQLETNTDAFIFLLERWENGNS